MSIAAILILTACDQKEEEHKEPPRKIGNALPDDYFAPPPPSPKMEPPADNDPAPNQIMRNAPDGSPTGITAGTKSPDNSEIFYSLADDADGAFAINTQTGQVTIKDNTKLSKLPRLSIIVKASTKEAKEAQQAFTIDILEPPAAPAPPPPPPPPPVDRSAEERAAAAAKLLEERAKAGPLIPDKETKPGLVSPAIPRLKDEDYAREETPRTDSSLPVDRRRIITADRVINAVLRNRINSQLPGIVTAIVDQNVFGADDRLILIPKGTAIIGRYEPLGKVGDKRLNVVWYRFIRPDGAHVFSDEEPYFFGQDLAGQTGLIGEVDNRIWERYGAAFITSLLSAASSATISVTDNETLTNTTNNLSQQFAQVTARVLDQQLNLAPIVTIDAGSLITIQPTKDIFVRKPIYPKDEEENKEQQP